MSQNAKEEELQHLNYFIEARESSLGERLTIVNPDERPDFICAKPTGELLGVELTKVAYEHDLTEAKRIMGEEREVDGLELNWAMYTSAKLKDEKRRQKDWKLPDSTILVMELVQGARVEDWPETDELSYDFADFGFVEIWLTDHSSIEAFSAVELLGIYPPAIWGLSGQDYLFGKPYG